MAATGVKAGGTSKYRKAGILIVPLVLILATSVFLALRHRLDGSGKGGENPSDLVRAEFLAASDSIVPGSELLIGVRFRIAPDWYIYAKDPGDAGLPTTVEITLPEGFRAEDFSYPVPIRFNQPGDILGYGYKEEVMLLARVSPPDSLVPGQEIRLQAHARWLACRHKCVPGDQRLTLSLPVSLQSRPTHEELFKKWRSQTPVGLKEVGE